jgi:hypothetical protein
MWKEGMRGWASLAVVLAALVWAAPALADDPASVYSDYASDGKLSCGHSRSALTGVLNDASLYQYGDPLTLLQLKFEIRRQLAGGCRSSTGAAAETGFGGSVPSRGESGGTAGNAGANAPAGPDTKRPPGGSGKAAGPAREPRPLVSGADTGHEDGRMVLLGAGLLLVALGAGGWAARRAFTGRQ